ncbi:hypothetical protein FZZ93_02385 [Halomonas eurihalina]|uniref:Uncharacterized protein n=1 Tax=Halomonas eurihalina TaxID=42566 RepID=A0A5D9DEK0_HALER|nr:hypothetical protein [Halomonas eurihalina]MDR5857958.1 hypothetical protein [Halomonas eurihalina]TZG41530.1 hypothetical protein FZZ93_02385 [Halomonas eurihalina]
MTWLLTIEARDAAGDAVTLRFSDGAYSAPTAQRWTPRIRQPGLYREGMYAGDLVSISRSGIGETTLINADGGLDYLADYAVDGREAVLSRVESGNVLEAWRGTVAGLSFSRGEVSVRLREPGTLLQTPHPHETYAGDNVLPDGLEGTEDDIAGQVKPRVYGDVRNAEPVLVNSAKLIYQVSSRADCAVSVVYDKGAALTDGGAYADLDALQTTAPAAGEFRAYQGYVRLGTSPEGQVTVDAASASTGAGAVMADIAAEAGETLDAADATNLNGVGTVGLYITDSVNTAALLDRLAVSVGGWWRLAPGGALRAHLLQAPSSPVATLADHQITSLGRSSTGAGDSGLPVWRVTVRADRLETTQTDVAASVDSARRARLARQYRDAKAERQTTRDRHPLADELTIETDLRSRADAQAVADRLADLLSVRRDRVTLEGRLAQSRQRAIGDTVTVTTPRLGYGQGRDMRIIGRELNARTGRITLELWG